MASNHLRALFRHAARNKGYTALNVLGLALGISCSLSIFLYVYDELTYDRHHVNIDSIYRLNGGWMSASDGSSKMYPGIGYVVGEYFKKDFPEVEHVVRVQWSSVSIEKPDTKEQFTESVFKTDPQAFRLFTLPLIAGSPENPLADNHAMVISRKMAEKYFGHTDVVGKTLRSVGADTVDWNITGVMEDYPDNTHLRYDFLVQLREPRQLPDDWFEYRYQTFFTLKSRDALEQVEERVSTFTKPYVAQLEQEIGYKQLHSITPMAAIHLYSHLAGENNGQAYTVYTFSFIGAFILIMACINFINLATARAIKRAKEIGIRKVVGAGRTQLMSQFMIEAFVTTFASAVIAIALLYTWLPTINSYSSKHIDLSSGVFWIAAIAISVVVSVLSGWYPATVLSAYQPIDTLKEHWRRPDGHGHLLRKVLVVFQFVVSASLIGGTLIAYQHLNFLRNKNLGFSKDNVIIVRGANEATKNQLLNLTGISGVSFSNKVPGMPVGGRTIYRGWSKDDPQIVLGQLVTDDDFIKLFNLELVAGRGFDKNSAADAAGAFLINEAAVGKLGYKNAHDAIGKPLWLDEDWGGKKGNIIGVLKDFHFVGVNSAIEPFSMFMHPSAKTCMSVKLATNHVADVLPEIEKIYAAHVPNTSFRYSFLDEDFDGQYRREDQFLVIFTFFASIGIALGCLGLYGLAMAMTEQRRKEVSIRKVMGASTLSVMTLLTSEFLKLVLIAFTIAVPLAYVGMNRWLGNFPYREPIDVGVFLSTGAMVFGISIITVGYQAVSAAMNRPAKALRSE